MNKRFSALVLAAALSLAFLAGCGSSSSAASSRVSSSSGASSSKAASSAAASSSAASAPVNELTGEARASGLSADTRPVAIMINNIREALPQTGIGDADVLFEMETEGGITRMMALFADPSSVPLIGPVRSARDQFVQFAMPLDAVYVHIGASTYARSMMDQYSFADLDGMSLGTTSFWFDEARAQTRASEHCWYTNADLIQKGIAATGVSATGTVTNLFSFAKQGEKLTLPNAAASVAFEFSGYGDCAMEYDAAGGTYKKSIYGAAQIDAGTNSQLAFTNVFVLYAPVSKYANTPLSDYDLSGGAGYYFTNGTFEPITYKKAGAQSMIQFFDANGKELSVATGKSYIAVVSSAYRDTLTVNGAAVQ